MRNTLEVTDLFKSAFLLCMGGNLSEVRVRNNGRRIATFLITGADLERFDSDYRTGRALVNPLELRESLNHLRDIMFDKLRGPASSRPRRGYAAAEGRERHGDRKRGDRPGQAY